MKEVVEESPSARAITATTVKPGSVTAVCSIFAIVCPETPLGTPAADETAQHLAVPAQASAPPHVLGPHVNVLGASGGQGASCTDPVLKLIPALRKGRTLRRRWIMANAEYLTELVRAHYSGDDRRFSTSSIRSSPRSRAAGAHTSRAPARRGSAPVPIRWLEPPRWPRAPRNLEQMLSVGYSETKALRPGLAPRTRASLERYVVEQRRAEALASHGLRPRRRLLLHGPPGWQDHDGAGVGR